MSRRAAACWCARSMRWTWCMLCVWMVTWVGVCADGSKPSAPVIVQALNPKGLRISVPDSTGVDIVVINANVNIPKEGETGQLTGNVLASKDGFWTLEAEDMKLKPGDVVFYWVYRAIGQNEEHIRGQQAIYNLHDPSCRPSPTTVNGRTVCSGEIIFEDSFDTFNSSIWKHSIQISDETDEDFSIYSNNLENSYVKDGTLHLKATPLQSEELTQPIKLEKCTWDGPDRRYCERHPIGWDILPPTRSAMLTTKGTFAFKFGRVEIRAKTAAGDWLMSRLILDPKDKAYGERPYESGRMEMLRSRGNPDVLEPTGWQLGARLNDPQAIIRTCDRNYYIFKNCPLRVDELYSDKMHIFSVTWSPQSIVLSVDGDCTHVIKPPEGGFLRHKNFRNNCYNSPWERGTYMAPFDKEFYLHIGLVVAGFNNYHEEVVSKGHKKPWNDRNAKAMLQFWKNKDIWLPTWKSDMEVDYVKVWAL